MRKNTALARWRNGEQTIGGWLSLANTHTAELLANAGFDWLCVDLQHGLLDYGDLRHMLPAISTTATVPIVRVHRNDAGDIGKVLDAGAMGVIVPMVNTREQAEAAVAACRYAPQGNRSFGPVRAGLYGGKGYAEEANDEIASIVMIETQEALDNVDEIVSTPGLGGVYIGPADLAISLGLPLASIAADERHLAAVTRIQDACRAHGVPIGIHTIGLADAQRRLAAGFHFVTLGSDAGFLMQAAASDLAVARKTTPAAGEKTGY